MYGRPRIKHNSTDTRQSWDSKVSQPGHHQTLFKKAKFSSLEHSVKVKTSVNPTRATSRRNKSVSLLIGLGEAMQKERGTVRGM